MTVPAAGVAMLGTHRVAHLATSAPDGQPHCMPVCFFFDGDTVYVPLDQKPKEVDVLKLKRVRNLAANPRVAFLVDHYSDDWQHLEWLHIQGDADLLHPGQAGHSLVVSELRNRYAQYQAMPIDQNPLIRIRPRHSRYWCYHE